jgi:hypothetical protein
MFNFPSSNRHVAYVDNKRKDGQQKQNTDANQLKDLSPDLSLLLSLVLKDKRQQNILPMLESIEPFLEPNDRKAVGNILGMSQQATRLNSYNQTHSMTNTGYQNLSKSDRQMALLDQLTRFSHGQSKGMMNQMTQTMKQQSDMARMMKRMSNMGSMDQSDPMAMFEMMSMFMPNGQMGEIKNIQNMMNLFKNMNGGDMSAMLKNFMK